MQLWLAQKQNKKKHTKSYRPQKGRKCNDSSKTDYLKKEILYTDLEYRLSVFASKLSNQAV